MNLYTPASQKADSCPITFLMDDESAGTSEEMTLYIRPEELSIGFPSRMTVNQTLGGAWADVFGEGLEEGNFAGTTGWRASNWDTGGVERMTNLKQFVYNDWHAKRGAAIAKGDDPGKVKLMLIDSLNQYARIIAPRYFELKRSRSRPLLAQYRFSFVAINKDLTGQSLISDDLGILTDAVSWIDSLSTSINNITSYVKSAYAWIDKTIVKPLKAFVATTQRLLTSVQNFVAAGTSVARQLAGVTRLATQAALNIWRSLSIVANLPTTAKGLLMAISGEYSNCLCLLRNAKLTESTYENYEDVYGASNCSSTTGGSAISPYSSATTNTMSYIVTNEAATVSVTQAASTQLNYLASKDLVFDSLSSSQISSSLSSINSSLSVLV